MGDGGAGVKTETFRPQEAGTDGITIKNDIQSDVLILFNNAFWGQVSLGYVRVGNSVTLPTIVNVDAYARYENGSGVFMTWPGPYWYYNIYKINLTPGERYSLSDFDSA